MNTVLAERYRLEAELARGAAGVVHRGIDLVTREPVAVKVLHAEAAAEPTVAAAFLAEAKVLSELNHPGIVRPRDLIVNGALMALVMDLVVGVDLRRTVVEDGPMAPVRAATIVSEVAQALAAVHAEGIVHGDVKPGNILVPADGGPARLVDFGVARRIASPDAPTHGTPDYTAPEIVDGQPSSSKSDVYGIGLVLYEALCGVNPYRGGSIDDVLERHRTSIPARPEMVPAELWNIIEPCLSLRPAERPDADSIPPMLRAVTALLPVEAAQRAYGAVEMRPRDVTPPAVMPSIVIAASPAAEMTPPKASAPPATVAPPVAVPLPGEVTADGRRPKPALLAGIAAGFVALVVAGMFAMTSIGAEADSGVETQPKGTEESIEPTDKGSEESSMEPTDETTVEPGEESTSADSEGAESSGDSTEDGGAGDDYGNGSDSTESETDNPWDDPIGSALPGKPGGR